MLQIWRPAGLHSTAASRLQQVSAQQRATRTCIEARCRATGIQAAQPGPKSSMSKRLLLQVL